MKLLSYIYYLLSSFRNFLYDKKIKKIKKITDIEIICIGNITVGGTGKTPAVQYLAKKLLNEGKKVAIVSRGYKGKRKTEPLIVCDGKKILCSSIESGDEPYLHALNLKIPIVVGRNRYNACKLVKEKFDVDIIILDDGFQHRKLYRDKNIVLIDASNPFGKRYLLPFGTLREPLKELKRATEFIITKSDLVEEKELNKIRRELFKYNKMIKVSIHKPICLYDLNYNRIELDFIKNKNVLLVSGLANPENFEKTIQSLKVGKINRLDYKDHYSFIEKDLEDIDLEFKEKKSDVIIITEKDFVKFPDNIKNRNIYILKIEFSVVEENKC